MKRDAAEQVIEPDLTEIYSESGIVVRLKDGKVMTQFNQNERIFPASLTKIMTCILALEEGRMDDLVTPIANGIRGMTLSPPTAGKITLLTYGDCLFRKRSRICIS